MERTFSKIKDFKPKFLAIVKRWKLSASLSTAEQWKKNSKIKNLQLHPIKVKLREQVWKWSHFKEELKRRGGNGWHEITAMKEEEGRRRRELHLDFFTWFPLISEVSKNVKGP